MHEMGATEMGNGEEVGWNKQVERHRKENKHGSGLLRAFCRLFHQPLS